MKTGIVFSNLKYHYKGNMDGEEINSEQWKRLFDINLYQLYFLALQEQLQDMILLKEF